MAYLQTDVTKVTTRVLQNMKLHGEKIAMLTAYDYSMASLLESTKIDVVLVGDSAANVMEGHKTTLPITLDEMIVYATSVVRAIKRALVVVDMPFGTYQGNSKQALASAIRIMKETGADAIKMEGGEEILESIQRILSAGIPVMGHLGLTPQSINKFGTYAVRATEQEEADRLKKDALLLQETGCFAIVLEKIPAKLADEVTSELKIPTIGIGAGGAGARAAGHAGHHTPVPAALPAHLRQHRRGYRQRHTPLHTGREERRFPQREGAVLSWRDNKKRSGAHGAPLLFVCLSRRSCKAGGNASTSGRSCVCSPRLSTAGRRRRCCPKGLRCRLCGEPS